MPSGPLGKVVLDSAGECSVTKGSVNWVFSPLS